MTEIDAPKTTNNEENKEDESQKKQEEDEEPEQLSLESPEIGKYLRP